MFRIWTSAVRTAARLRSDRRRLRPGLEPLEGRDLPAPLVVTNTDDMGPGSLRDAIQQAQADVVHNEIDIDVQGTIGLKSPLPDLTGTLRIIGPGADQLKVRSATSGFRIFRVAPGATIELCNVTIAEGHAQDGDGAYTRGGGIYNQGSLTLDYVRVYHNSAVFGGGIYNEGNVSVYNSTLDVNVSATEIRNGSIAAYSEGAAYYGAPGSRLDMNQSTVSTNFAAGLSGLVGGIELDVNASASIGRSTIANNFSQYNSGDNTVQDTVGAGLNVTFDPGNGGGKGWAELYNTIVAGNHFNLGTPTYDISGPVSQASRFNLVGNGDAMWGMADGNGGNKIGSPTEGRAYFAELGPLQNNGGRVPTHALMAGSAAIDAGDIDYADTPGDFDQRIHRRVVNGRLDIGACEYQPPTVNLHLTASPDPVAGQSTTLTMTVTPDTPRSNPPTGVVTFYYNEYDKPNFLGVIDVVNGKAVLSDVTIPADAKLIGAQYEGDSDFSGYQVEIQVTPAPG